MYLTLALGLCGVLTIMLQPLRFILKNKRAFAGLGNKAFASMFFCLAGVAAAGARESIHWQAAVILLSFCLAAIGDVLLAMGPVLVDPKADRNFVFAAGGMSFAAAHVLSAAALLSLVRLDWRLLPLAFALPVLYAVLWAAKKFRFGRKGGPILFYALVLGAILWAAAMALAVNRALGLLALAAALLYMFSDTALFFANFGSAAAKEKLRSGKSFLWLVMLPYYSAQALLACAVIFM